MGGESQSRTGPAPGRGRAAAAPGPERLAAALTAIADSGDREAFRLLFTSLAPAVKGLAMRQGADAASAEEIVQETFLAVWRKARLYAPARGGASGWVFAIARNVRIDRLRREPAWQELTDEAELEPADETPADESLASRQNQTRLRGVLASLPADQAAVVRLAYDEGLSHSEIAARLAAPLGTVKTRMNLAYQKIRAAMKDYR